MDPETKRITDEVNRANSNCEYDRYFCMAVSNLIPELNRYGYATKPGPNVLHVTKNEINLDIVSMPCEIQEHILSSCDNAEEEEEAYEYRYLIEVNGDEKTYLMAAKDIPNVCNAILSYEFHKIIKEKLHNLNPGGIMLFRRMTDDGQTVILSVNVYSDDNIKTDN